jgi:transcriptional regulator with XRE-family HTH domain
MFAQGEEHSMTTKGGRRGPPPSALREAGARITERRTALGWSQSDLARNVEAHYGRQIGRSEILRYERGEADPSMERRLAIAKTLGVVPTDIWRDMIAGAELADEPPSRVSVTDSGKGSARLVIDKDVPRDIATQIMRLLWATDNAA